MKALVVGQTVTVMILTATLTSGLTPAPRGGSIALTAVPRPTPSRGRLHSADEPESAVGAVVSAAGAGVAAVSATAQA